MSLLDTYKQKLEIQIKEHKAHLELLKARTKQVTTQGKIELARADKHLQQARTRFNELKGASGGAFTDIKAGLSKALADLKVSTKKAARHFDTKAPAAKPAPAKKRTKPKAAKSRKP